MNNKLKAVLYTAMAVIAIIAISFVVTATSEIMGIALMVQIMGMSILIFVMYLMFLAQIESNKDNE
jgi:predicted MFS family arabinose efflux permease